MESKSKNGDGSRERLLRGAFAVTQTHGGKRVSRVGGCCGWKCVLLSIVILAGGAFAVFHFILHDQINIGR
jgi:hypothetical protein